MRVQAVSKLGLGRLHIGVNLQWFIRSDAAPYDDGVTVLSSDLATKYL